MLPGRRLCLCKLGRCPRRWPPDSPDPRPQILSLAIVSQSILEFNSPVAKPSKRSARYNGAVLQHSVGMFRGDLLRHDEPLITTKMVNVAA